jgi:hypothetical protein
LTRSQAEFLAVDPLVKQGGHDDAIRSYENQRHRASGLNLLVATIILWNTTYLQRAIDHCAIKGNIRNRVIWRICRRSAHTEAAHFLRHGPDQFRPLRTRAQDLTAAGINPF